MKHLVFALLILPLSALAEGGLPDQPYIYVQGRAETKKEADIATLNFSLAGRNADEAKANHDVQAKAAKVFSLLDTMKVAQNDVIAGDIISEPEYENGNEFSERRGKLIGYSVKRSFSIKLRDVKLLAKLVDELFAIGGAELSGIQPGLSNQKQIEDQVWDKALADARERAEKTVSGMAMKIDSVFAVSPITFPEIPREIFGTGPVEAYATAAKTAQYAAPQYRLAPVTVSQAVHVIYLISPGK
jgi:uncharacterized protein YggE